MSADLERLADAVKARRDELDLTQEQVAAAGGPSDTTLSKIEAGAADPVARSTLRKLDAGLSWMPGSARRVLSGEGEPIPIPRGIVVPVHQTAEVAHSLDLSKPDNVSDEAHQRILRETEEFYRFKVQQAAETAMG